MTHEAIIRPEAPGDVQAIHRVEVAAFGQGDEAKLVDQLRAHNAHTLSLVAELHNEIVGHILFTPVTIEGEDATVNALGLAPLAVMPGHQNKGIGSALVETGLERCRKTGHLLVFVVGHVTYFPRFGFRPAVPLGFDCDYVSHEGPVGHFMVTELMAGALRGQCGYVRFRPEFDNV